MSGSQATKTMTGAQTLCQEADVEFEPGHSTSTFQRLDRRRDH